MRHELHPRRGRLAERVIMRAALTSTLIAAPLYSIQAQRSGAPDAAAVPPRLVVLIAVDQLRADYLDRYASQLTGGLARIRAHAAYFANGRQDHAITETAPGHATMLSGREPVHTGIVTNGRGVPDDSAPLIGTTGPGASPRRFRGTTLVDWLMARDPSIRVLSVSRKDRGAILPIGRARAAVFWFAGGRFTTSRYYADTLPAWVRDFDANMHLARLAGTDWTLLRPAADYGEPDSVPVEHGGTDYTFPHVLPDSAGIARGIEAYPVMDSITLAFAVRGVRALGLGKAHTASMHARMPDVLSISLSTTDAVGHAYGPDSREIHDQVLRLDRWLSSFLDSLASQVPPERMLLVLTADHGVSSFPELAVARTGRGGRVWLADIAREAAAALEERYHSNFGVAFDEGLVLADVQAMRARGVNVDSVEDALAAAAAARAGVARVFTPRTLAAAADTDAAAVRWRRTLPPDLGWLLCAVPKAGFLWSNGGLRAEHGTPNADDLAVPIAIVGAEIRAARHEELVRTVDIAPTLAALLGIAPTEAVDGQPIRAVIGSGAASADGSDR